MAIDDVELEKLKEKKMKEYNAKRLYTNIHKLCRTNNVNIGDLEREIGFRLGYFSRVYHGAAAPRCDCLIKVCNKFNITMDELLFEEIKTYKEKIYEKHLEQLKEFYERADGELKETLNYTIDDIQKKLEKERL